MTNMEPIDNMVTIIDSPCKAVVSRKGTNTQRGGRYSVRFCSFSSSGKVSVGVVDAEMRQLWPVERLIPDHHGDLTDLIAAHPNPNFAPRDAGIPSSAIEFLAPLPRPRRNLFCVGKNYQEHAREFSASGFDASAAKGEDIPEHPIFFTKAPGSVIGPGVPIDAHRDLTHQLDYEAELAVVIGRGGRNIRKDRALHHVWGYTIVNDVTARDLQRKHRQWFIGKSLDGFCPMGPCIVTADEIDAANLAVRCWVNGELRQSARTSDLIFDIPTLIETLSAGITLEPGDVIATGTPAGVGIGFDPPRFLQPGDVVKIEIERIGILENRVA
jgi:2-keto-4-pentenoate hydratase/2-oxohepta-3-ene-1,7-dioic acid hydratase in catechol pathway